MKKNKLLSTPRLFVQDFGVFPVDVLVAYGCPKEAVIEYLTKSKSSREFVKAIKNKLDAASDGGVGGFTSFDGRRCFLWLDATGDKFDLVVNLVHETNHMVLIGCQQKISGVGKGGELELESAAYTQQYLFDSIFRKITGKGKIPKEDDVLANLRKK
ncbi:MAG: hypothetical protein WC455_10640 [Dehalococcoidia bacterium]|jgi:hypothetical protein